MGDTEAEAAAATAQYPLVCGNFSFSIIHYLYIYWNDVHSREHRSGTVAARLATLQTKAMPLGLLTKITTTHGRSDTSSP